MIRLYISREFKPLGITRKRLLALLRWHREHAICWQLLLQIYSKCFPAVHQIVCCKETSGKVRAILHSALALHHPLKHLTQWRGWNGVGRENWAGVDIVGSMEAVETIEAPVLARQGFASDFA